MFNRKLLACIACLFCATAWGQIFNLSIINVGEPLRFNVYDLGAAGSCDENGIKTATPLKDINPPFKGYHRLEQINATLLCVTASPHKCNPGSSCKDAEYYSLHATGYAVENSEVLGFFAPEKKAITLVGFEPETLPAPSKP